MYGLPEQWPHVHAVLRRAGFTPEEHADLVLLADVSALPRPPSPLAGLSVARTLGVNGTRFTAPLDEQPVGDLEVQQRGDAGRLVTQQGFADAGNLHLKPATAAAASALGCWARLPTGCTSATPIGCWMDYCSPDDEGYRAFPAPRRLPPAHSHHPRMGEAHHDRPLSSDCPIASVAAGLPSSLPKVQDVCGT